MKKIIISLQKKITLFCFGLLMLVSFDTFAGAVAGVTFTNNLPSATLDQSYSATLTYDPNDNVNNSIGFPDGNSSGYLPFVGPWAGLSLSNFTALPSGLVLSSLGQEVTISGTPTSLGFFTFNLSGNDWSNSSYLINEYVPYTFISNSPRGIINPVNDLILNGPYGVFYRGLTSDPIDGIANSGQISGASVGIAIQNSQFSGGITNSGSLANIHGDSIGISINNESSLNGGIHNADGAIIDSTFSEAIQLSNGSILNGGIHNTNNSSISAGQGIVISSSTLNGGIHNSDSEIVANGGEGSAIYLNGLNFTLNGGINNSGTGQIRATGDAGNAIYISGFSLNDGINNSAAISANGIDARGIVFEGATLNGGINNSGTGEIRATGNATYPNYIKAIYMNSSTLNDGINNAGAISADDTNGVGVDIVGSSTLNGGINNSGSISGNGVGIRIDNGLFNGGINNAETGSINGTGLGIHILSSSLLPGGPINSSIFNGGINNAGTISSIAIEGSAFSGGINNAGTIDSPHSAIQINSSQFTGGINNSGTISGSNMGSGISTYNVSSDSSSIDAITNTLTGIISASGIFAIGINNIYTTIGTLTNMGSISGDKGISNVGGGSIINTLNNSGTISGLNTAIYNDNGSAIETLTNNGTISGDSYGVFNDWATITSLINIGTISSSNGDAINTYNDPINSGGIPSISTLTNTGTITSLDNGYGINTEWGSFGTIGTLNNFQGVGNSSGALTFNGYLPTNYNIIINQGNYGQLVSSNNFSSTTNFGISSLSGRITQLTYSGVMYGVTSSNFTNYQTRGTSWGTYLGANWQLLPQTDPTIWDLNFFSLPIYGPLAADTQSSMHYQSRLLRSAFNTQTVAANSALNYDCKIFDVKGMCISVGGRYTTIDNPGINDSAAVVTLGYKVNPHIRVGAYLDQNINISKPSGVNITNNTPLMGLYAVWNKEQNGLGYQVKLANTYQDKDVTQTRTIFDTSEAGSGRSSLTSQSYLAELSYAFQYQDKTLVRPYAGLRYTHLKQDGYTEATVAGSVEDPLTLASLKDKSTWALLGVKLNQNITEKATLTAQLGLEQDLYHKVDNYSATDLNGSDLTAVAFNSNIKGTRPIASLGAFYDVTKTQRASATINYQQLSFQSTGSATAYVHYTIGF